MKTLRFTALLLVFYLLPGAGYPAEFFVSSGDAPGLIAAINEANAIGGDNSISLAAGTYTLTGATIFGDTGLPDVTGNVTIEGTGANTTVIERDPSAPPFRIFFVAASASLALRGLTIQNGSGGPGAGIFNAGGEVLIQDSALVGNRSSLGAGGLANGGGVVTIIQSTFKENSAHFLGGGLTNSEGRMTISGSTFIRNQAGFGGAIANLGNGSAEITNSTISENVADEGGGVYQNRGAFGLGSVVIRNSTVAYNRGGGLFVIEPGGIIPCAPGGIFDCNDHPDLVPGERVRLLLMNSIVALNFDGADCTDNDNLVWLWGRNLIGDATDCVSTGDLTGDPGLASFTDDGTPGRGYFPLLPTSPAIDAGLDCPPADQLGNPRVGPCDIGAIEFQPVKDTIPPALNVSASPTALWPPNGKLVPVTVSGSITDEINGSGVDASSAAYTVADEYGRIQPTGGITLGADGWFTFTVGLEASRRGSDQDGRRYTVTVSVSDKAGNLGVASTIVTVPHDQGQ